MAGVEVAIDPAALARLAAIGRDVAHDTGLLDGLGTLLVGAVQVRLSEEKRSAAGAAWDAWSVKYAKTRHAGQSLLVGEGALLTSIDSRSGPGEVSVGSNLIYAAIHQFGGAEVGRPALPARPYLGLSAADEAAIAAEIEAFVNDRSGR